MTCRHCGAKLNKGKRGGQACWCPNNPVCQEHKRQYNLTYRRKYIRKRRSQPSINPKNLRYVITSRICRICGVAILDIYDQEGVKTFESWRVCHKEQCQATYKIESSNLSGPGEVEVMSMEEIMGWSTVPLYPGTY